MFERFTRLDEGRVRGAGGAGLGLALVRAVATAHGGTVAVTDAPLGGARFEVALPADAQLAVVVVPRPRSITSSRESLIDTLYWWRPVPSAGNVWPRHGSRNCWELACHWTAHDTCSPSGTAANASQPDSSSVPEWFTTM